MTDSATGTPADRTFCIVTAADRRMLPAACCALLSARDNVRLDNVSYYLIGSDLDDEDRGKLFEFSRANGIVITLVEMSEKNLGDEELRRYGKASLGRLHMPELLPASFDRVLYLDADVLVLGDIGELVVKDIDGKPLAAVQALTVGKIDKLRRRKIALGLDEGDPYFNSGVMLFDWKKTLEGEFLQRAYHRLNGTRRFDAPDQDVLNQVFHRNWHRLDFAWNMKAAYLSLEPQTRIIHFYGVSKPWSARAKYSLGRFRDIYRQELNATWPGFVKDPGALKNILLILEYPGFMMKMRWRRRQARLYYFGRNAGR